MATPEPRQLTVYVFLLFLVYRNFILYQSLVGSSWFSFLTFFFLLSLSLPFKYLISHCQVFRAERWLTSLLLIIIKGELIHLKW